MSEVVKSDEYTIPALRRILEAGDQVEGGHSSTIGSHELAKACYIAYGEYVNKSRMIPHIGDGLIPVHRRVLLSASTCTTMTKTAAIAADAVQKYHPHSNVSVEEVVSRLVRRGLLKGKGNHGISLMEDVPPAAARYTGALMYPQIKDALVSLHKYAPHFDNELGNSEPVHLVVPVPIMLMYGHSGIGLGCATRIPAFTFQSLLDAYHANDPSLLKGQYGYELDVVKSELKSLWLHGEGRLNFTMPVTEDQDDDGQRIFRIQGSGDMFKPTFGGELGNYIENQQVFIRNDSSSILNVALGRTKGTRAVSDDRIHELAVRAASFRRHFRIWVNDGKIVRQIGIRDWIGHTLKLYNKSFEKRRTDQINRISHKITLNEITGLVASGLQSDQSDTAILKSVTEAIEKGTIKLSFPRPVNKANIDEVMSRPIRMLRKKDFKPANDKLKTQLKEVKESSVEDSIHNCVETVNGLLPDHWTNK